MNKKGQQVAFGGMIMLAVVLIVALNLFVASAQNVGTTRNTVTASNVTYTMPKTGSANAIALGGQELLSTPVVWNQTNATVNSTNYTIAEAVLNGEKRVVLTNLDGTWNDTALNFSYNYGAVGYIDNGGGRSMAYLIVIMSALAIAVVAITYAVKKNNLS